MKQRSRLPARRQPSNYVTMMILFAENEMEVSGWVLVAEDFVDYKGIKNIVDKRPTQIKNIIKLLIMKI